MRKTSLDIRVFHARPSGRSVEINSIDRIIVIIFLEAVIAIQKVQCQTHLVLHQQNHALILYETEANKLAE